MKVTLLNLPIRRVSCRGTRDDRTKERKEKSDIFNPDVRVNLFFKITPFEFIKISLCPYVIWKRLEDVVSWNLRNKFRRKLVQKCLSSLSNEYIFVRV